MKIVGKNVADVKGVKRLKKGITLKNCRVGTTRSASSRRPVLKQHLSGSQSYQSRTKRLSETVEL